jgi:hypothetical protein
MKIFLDDFPIYNDMDSSAKTPTMLSKVQGVWDQSKPR